MSTTTDNAEREAFDKWAKRHGLNVARHRIAHTDYDCDDTQWAWLSWQARATPAEPDAELVKVLEKISDPLLNYKVSVTGTAGAIQMINAIATDARSALASLPTNEGNLTAISDTQNSLTIKNDENRWSTHEAVQMTSEEAMKIINSVAMTADSEARDIFQALSAVANITKKP